jgi:hypothetical protein
MGSQAYLHKIQNGQIFYGGFNNLFILNNKTLKIDRKIIAENGAEGSNYITSYQTAQDGTLLIRSTDICKYRVHRLNPNTSKYEFLNQLYACTDNLVLISPLEAASIYSGNLLHFDIGAAQVK